MVSELLRRFTGVALFALPVVLVKVAAVMFNASGPQTSEAADLDSGMDFVLAQEDAPSALTVEQQNLMTLMQEARTRPFSASPLLHREESDSEPPPVPPDSGEPEVETFEVMISAIMSSSRGAVALIDGKPRRVGDTIRDDQWRVAAIDIDQRSVTFANVADGRTETRLVPVAP